MEKLYIVKIGGNTIDHTDNLKAFLKAFSSVPGKKILVHGGGKLANKLATQLNIPQQMHEGRRITDKETLKVVTMVYAGDINKNIVAGLQREGVNAIGLCGADGQLILAHKRVKSAVDFGFVGDIDQINTTLLKILLKEGMTPVVAPISMSKEGQVLNTNADTVASAIATAISSQYSTELVFCFEKNGVLENQEDEKSVINKINREIFLRLKNEKKIFAGMLPKLDNAFSAIEKGVNKVTIGNAMEIAQLIKGEAGSSITEA